MTDTSDMNDFNRKVIEEFHANDGVVPSFGDMPIVLLHTTGAKSGKERVSPLVCLPEDGRLYVFGSKGGADTHPDWYRNLTAHPEVEVEYGTERYPARAEELTGAERDEVFERQKAVAPQFAGYEKATSRVIPVVALVRADG